MRYHARSKGITHIVAFNAINAERAIAAGVDVKIALSFRGTKFASDPALGKKYREIAGQCDYLVTNSGNTAGLIEESGMAGKCDVVVIRNGVEVPPEISRPDGKTVLWVGSMKDVKDPMTFLEACNALIANDGEIMVIMAGAGPMRSDIERYICEKGLTGNFTLPGEVPFDEIPYAKASVFVNSSVRESSSNSLLEALSFGIPVVATDNPGNRDILDGLGHHRVVSGSDPALLAGAIRDLIDIDEDARREIAAESRRYIEDRHSVSDMVDGYIRLLSGE
jgi:glycosyltransferase involved in cell wall biosynthesis